MIVLFLVFKGTSTLFSTQLAPIISDSRRKQVLMERRNLPHLPSHDPNTVTGLDIFHNHFSKCVGKKVI